MEQIVERTIPVQRQVPVPYTVHLQHRLATSPCKTWWLHSLATVNFMFIFFIQVTQPVETIVNRDVPYPVEQIVEKIVERCVPQPYQVQVTVPVQVPQPYTVEKIIDRFL